VIHHVEPITNRLVGDIAVCRSRALPYDVEVNIDGDGSGAALGHDGVVSL
jgi:hypothetical protein